MLVQAPISMLSVFLSSVVAIHMASSLHGELMRSGHFPSGVPAAKMFLAGAGLCGRTTVAQVSGVGVPGM
jgi:hypothetical protein